MGKPRKNGGKMKDKMRRVFGQLLEWEILWTRKLAIFWGWGDSEGTFLGNWRCLFRVLMGQKSAWGGGNCPERKCSKMIIFLCLVVTGTMVFFSIFSRNSQLTPFFFRGVGPGRSTTNQIWVNIPWSSQQTPVHCSNHVLYDMKSYEIPFYMSKSEFQVCPSIWRSVLWSPVCVWFFFSDAFPWLLSMIGLVFFASCFATIVPWFFDAVLCMLFDVSRTFST